MVRRGSRVQIPEEAPLLLHAVRLDSMITMYELQDAVPSGARSGYSLWGGLVGAVGMGRDLADASGKRDATGGVTHPLLHLRLLAA